MRGAGEPRLTTFSETEGKELDHMVVYRLEKLVRTPKCIQPFDSATSSMSISSQCKDCRGVLTEHLLLCCKPGVSEAI